MHKENSYDLAAAYYNSTSNTTAWQTVSKLFENKTTKYKNARDFYVHMGSKIDDMLIQCVAVDFCRT